jgi:hypothetical protein
MTEAKPKDEEIDGEISRIHGDKSIEEMRRVYGDEFAEAFEPLNKLSDALCATGEKALKLIHRAALHADHVDGSLAKKLNKTILRRN